MKLEYLLAGMLCATTAFGAGKVFRAGSVAMDVTPTSFPVIVNGGFLSKTADKVHDRLHVRWLVLDDGRTRVALGVLDTCVIPGEFADEVKARARKLTGIPADRIMLSATHTHSAPSLMQCLGTPPDPHYAAFALPRIVEGLQRAVDNLAPARVGWAVVQAPNHTHTRVWVRRPDKMLTDPFGEVSVRAMMHPGYQNPDAIAPAGPSDPALTLLAVQSPEGRPIAVMANYSMHYFGAPAISADYYGRFAEKIGPLIGVTDSHPAFVGIMSQGTSGDQHWMDYSQPKPAINIDSYASELARIAADAYKTIVFHDSAPLVMREKTLRLATRQPDAKRLAWARDLVEKTGDRLPKSQPEVYAREQLWLKANPKRAVKLQALRVGELGIATWPCEVFAISGLKIKAQSPLQPTMNIELANGEEGYIPPPELHPLGGYNTWACRTAGLEVNAEPKIVDALLGLLEKVSGQPRRRVPVTHGAYAQAVLAARPLAYWRMDEGNGTTAMDATPARRNATYEPGVARWLDGPATAAFSGAGTTNRCVHFAGRRLNATLKELKNAYTVELWFWNGLPETLRPVTGTLFARGDDCLSIGGTTNAPGKLVLGTLTGRTAIAPKTWNHVVFVRESERVAVYLNGNREPELSAIVPAAPNASKQVSIAGDADNAASFEGKIDEVAIYNRALAAGDAATHWQASGIAEKRAAEAAEQERLVRLAAERARPPQFSADYSRVIASLKPAVHWPLTAPAGGTPALRVEGSVSFSPGTFAAFSGGRLASRCEQLGGQYSVAFWFRNDLPNDARAVTAYLFSRGPDGDRAAPGDHLAIGGTHGRNAGRLAFFNGNQRDQFLLSKGTIPAGAWNHVVLVRSDRRVTAFLNGASEPIVDGEADVTTLGAPTFFLGARCDQFAPLEGYLAEFALFNRALGAAEAAQLYRAANPSANLARGAIQ